MAQGIAAYGDIPVELYEHQYSGRQDPAFHLIDIAVFYGLEGGLPLIMRDFAQQGWAVYVDLGYWGRRAGGRWSGYHKVVVNGRHPNHYFRKPQHDRSRINRFNVLAQPWRADGDHILLAGMGDKGALAEGLKPEEWERWAIAEIRKYSDRRIVYRAKPSWKDATPIAGTDWSPRERDVETELANAWAVVTHHSNVAVDALVAGVPTFCWGGVAKELSSQELGRIENPYYPEGRDAWMADIAWVQWSIDEMARGYCWRHLRTEGLV